MLGLAKPINVGHRRRGLMNHEWYLDSIHVAKVSKGKSLVLLCDFVTNYQAGVAIDKQSLRHGIARLALDHIDLLVVYGLHSCHSNLRVSILPVDHTRGIKNRDSLS